VRILTAVDYDLWLSDVLTTVLVSTESKVSMLSKRFPEDWCFSELYKFSRDIVSQLKVSNEIKTLLEKTGLPVQLFQTSKYQSASEFQLETELPLLYDLADIPLLSNAHQNFRVLYSMDNRIYLCFDNAEQTTVVDINVDETDSQHLYVNASLMKFTECLSAYRHFEQHIEEIPTYWEDQEIYLTTGEVKVIPVYNQEGDDFYNANAETMFTEIDPTIFACNASFWSLIRYI